MSQIILKKSYKVKHKTKLKTELKRTEKEKVNMNDFIDSETEIEEIDIQT